MAWPANITTKTVTATFYDMQTELPATGSVTFTPSPPNGVWFLDPAATTVVVPTPTTVQMDANGAISVVLPCTDDPDLSPINWTWHCKMVSGTGQVAEFDFSLPSASVSPVDLSGIINIPVPAAPAGLYAKSVNGVTPDINGNVTLFTIAPTILGNMADVNAPTPSNLNILSWDTATNKWIKSGRLTTVETNLGTWSGGTAISRIQGLETSQSIRYETNAATTCNNAVDTDIPFGTVVRSNTSVFTVSAANFTAVKTGWVDAATAIRMGGGTTALEVKIKLNGNLVVETSGGSTLMGNIATGFPVVAGDIIKVSVFHNSGAAKPLETGAGRNNHVVLSWRGL